MKIPIWPCIGTGKWEMWLDSLFWTHLQSDVGENYQVWSLESGLSRDFTSVCDKFLFLDLWKTVLYDFCQISKTLWQRYETKVAVSEVKINLFLPQTGGFLIVPPFWIIALSYLVTDYISDFLLQNINFPLLVGWGGVGDSAFTH